MLFNQVKKSTFEDPSFLQGNQGYQPGILLKIVTIILEHMNLDSTLALGGGMGFSQDTGRQGWKMKKEKPQVVSKTFFFFFEKCFLLIFPVVSQRPYTF